jgi:Ca2+-binding EF-hand superfamily protein
MRANPFVIVLAALAAAPAAAAAQEGGFAAADADRNGLLSRAEVERSLPRLALRFGALDTNRDGNLSPQDLRARGNARHRGEGGFAEHFRRADVDQDGALTRGEAEQALPRVAAKFDRIDADRDGRLTPHELRRYFDARRTARGKAGPAAP